MFFVFCLVLLKPIAVVIRGQRLEKTEQGWLKTGKVRVWHDSIDMVILNFMNLPENPGKMIAEIEGRLATIRLTLGEALLREAYPGVGVRP